MSPGKSFLMFVALKCFGHKNELKTNQPMQYNITAVHDTPSPTTEMN